MTTTDQLADLVAQYNTARNEQEAALGDAFNEEDFRTWYTGGCEWGWPRS